MKIFAHCFTGTVSLLGRKACRYSCEAWHVFLRVNGCDFGERRRPALLISGYV